MNAVPSPTAVPVHRVAGHALGLLRRPGWQRALLFVVVATVVFLLLGRWQWHRYQGRVARNDLVAANYGRAPAALSAVLASPAAALTAAQPWTPVRVSGTYLVQRTVLIRNRPLNGVYGFEVVVPLQLGDGSVLLVDRGWIANGQSAEAVPAPPAPPTGQVTVVARLRPSEPADSRSAPVGQAQRIAVAALTTGWGTAVYQAYGVLASESPSPATAPSALPEPDLDEGPFLPYAVEWVGFALTAWILLGYYLLRQAKIDLGVLPAPTAVRTSGPATARREASRPASAVPGAPGPASPGPSASEPGTDDGPGLPLPGRPARRSRRRPDRDAELEDAVLDALETAHDPAGPIR